MNPLTFDIKSYKSSIPSIQTYFDYSHKLKECKKEIESINRKTPHVDCPICQEHIEDNIRIDGFRCRHLFHESCLKSWIDTKGKDATCPTCRCEKTGRIHTYSQWKLFYSGVFESVTRPRCEFSEMEDVQRLRVRRYNVTVFALNLIRQVVSFKSSKAQF